MVAVDLTVQAQVIAEVTAIKGAIDSSAATNPSSAPPNLVALDAALTTLENDLSQASGTVAAAVLSADAAAVDAAWTSPPTVNAMAAGDPPAGGGGKIEGGTPIGPGNGPKTGTPIPPFDPSNPLGSIGGRLKWRWQNSTWSGGIWIQSPDFPGAPN